MLSSKLAATFRPALSRSRRRLARPAAAEGLDQEDGCVQPVQLRLGGGELVGQQGLVGGDHLQIIRQALPVLQFGQA
jgi:hypothetical protein